MWCANCQTDVAAQVSDDHRHVYCAACGIELKTWDVPRQGDRTREARDILERWSSSQLFDPYAPLPGLEAAETPHAPGSPETPRADHRPQNRPPGEAKTGDASAGHSPSSQAFFRLDGSHQLGDDQTDSQGAPSASNAASSPRSAGEAASRLDESHQSEQPRPPHFELGQALREPRGRKSSSMTVIGQFLAYTGVLGLTIGTALILWGYFGPAARLMPTGWLITTGGQMLLFLGIVTLVSGGMEQQSDEVTRKIETLGEHILRIEQASHGHALRGPSIPAERFSTESSTSHPRQGRSQAQYPG